MKIGILDADELKKEVIKEYGTYSDMFVQLFQSVDTSHTFNSYPVCQKIYPNDINDCDAYIITGSKASAYDNDSWIKLLKSYILLLLKQKKKLVGICFGHQIIAEALGGQVKKNNNGWGVGLMTNTVLDEKSWMKPKQKEVDLLVSHQDQVVTLPDNAELIATNSFCLNSGFQISDQLITLQGHPEFSNAYLMFLMQGRREVIGEENYQHALTSLKQPADDKLIAKWILEFLKE